MKRLLSVLLMAAVAVSAKAQNAGAADTTAKGFPVLRSYVAPDAVQRARKKYGRALYSIEKSTAANCQQSYLVGLIRNGRLTMEWMCDDPKIVFRSAHGTFILREG